MKTALTEGISALIYLEARLQSDSGNANYTGFKADAANNAFVDYISGKGSLEAAAQAMAGEFRTAIQTQTLTVTEKARLMGTLTDMVGSAELAQAYVEMDSADIGTTAQEYVDSKTGVGDNGNSAISGIKKYKTTTELLTESSCADSDLYNYLKNIDKAAAEEFLKSGTWPDGEQIPKSPDVLNADGTIKWEKAPEGGYVLDSSGKAIKKEYSPFVNEIIDRFGPPNGRYVCPVKDGKPYGYSKRALPFIEDASQYHQYKVIGDFGNIEEYVRSCSDDVLKSNIYEYVNIYYEGDFSKITVYRGEIAGIDGWGIGRGTQYELPMKIEWLVSLGILIEINLY